MQLLIQISLNMEYDKTDVFISESFENLYSAKACVKVRTFPILN